jgi:sugar phosphate isomerase/epimerase
MKSLDEIARYSEEKKIKVGLETRLFYEEIPNFEEFKIIFDKFNGSNIYYWHDMGHAQVFENLGFEKHEDFLKSYSNRMLGIHMHDIIGCDDHQAAGVGSMDFDMVARYINENTIKVVETHAKASKSDLISSLNFLKSKKIT